MQFIKKLICGAAILVFGASNLQATDCEPWKITIAPYIWAMNMSGDTQIASQSLHISESFSDILKDFHGGGMLWLDVTKGHYSLFINSLYAVLKKNTTVDGFNLQSESKFGLFTMGGSYRAYQRKYNRYSYFAIEPYIGARYTLNDSSIDVQGTSISASKNVNWTDPIVGAKFLYNINRNWNAKFAADVGGTNFNTDKSYNLNAFVGYSPAEIFTLYLGYRMLYQHYETGTGINLFVWKMHLFGPVLGFAFTF